MVFTELISKKGYRDKNFFFKLSINVNNILIIFHFLIETIHM